MRAVGAGLPAVVVLILVSQGSAAAASRADSVTVTCDRPELVAGKPLHVVRVREAKEAGDISTVGSAANRPPTHLRVDFPKAPRFNNQGVCTVRLKEGRYRFDVLYRMQGIFVALTSGEIALKDDEES